MHSENENSQARNVLVIGGSRGIGEAIVRRFAEQGDRVTFTYASSEEKAQTIAQQTQSQAVKLDVSDRDALIDAVAEAGALDVLVFNAGLLSAGDPLETAADEIEKLFIVNIHAPYFAAVEAAREMNKGGRIIIIGSVNADRIPMKGLTAYGTSKAALQGVAKGLARDFGDREITVNVIQPGPTDTDMNPAEGPMNETMHSFMAIKRHAHASEVAGMVYWVAGPEASMVTGAALTIDGGFGA
ncbi:SDR family oxidoreductase [Candidatus Pantoea bituminis]|jgi:cyclic-di-GMP-binding biofilm dispersal mediator protein|uniref:SDR family oxidoreductase n=1 Tax=Candidatus Pantoea bituminis TaxID=2831036 RepID=UPI001C0633AC|nr:SDR family oxidoreductase [Pantoea bituminis]